MVCVAESFISFGAGDEWGSLAFSEGLFFPLLDKVVKVQGRRVL